MDGGGGEKMADSIRMRALVPCAACVRLVALCVCDEIVEWIAVYIYTCVRMDWHGAWIIK